MWNTTYCEHCGKMKSATWWNPAVAAAAPAMPATYAPLNVNGTATQPLPSWQQFNNAGAAAQPTFFEMCNCQVSVMSGSTLRLYS